MQYEIQWHVLPTYFYTLCYAVITSVQYVVLRSLDLDENVHRHADGSPSQPD